jgi:hypothetical protein
MTTHLPQPHSFRSSTKRFFILMALCVLAIPALTLPALAKAKSSSQPTEVITENQKAVLSVSPKENTVTVDFNSTKEITTYTVDDLTVIEVNGQPAKLSAVKKGMIVTDLMERDSHTLDRFAVKTYIKEVKVK